MLHRSLSRSLRKRKKHEAGASLALIERISGQQERHEGYER